MHRRLLHSPLSISEADDLHVGQIEEARKTPMLQYEIVLTVVVVTGHIDNLGDYRGSFACSYSMMIIFCIVFHSFEDRTG